MPVILWTLNALHFLEPLQHSKFPRAVLRIVQFRLPRSVHEAPGNISISRVKGRAQVGFEAGCQGGIRQERVGKTEEPSRGHSCLQQLWRVGNEETVWESNSELNTEKRAAREQ